MIDRRGDTICEKTDRFRFDPPLHFDSEGSPEYLASVRGIRGRVVQIRKVVTEGRHAGLTTVALKSRDPYMAEWLKGLGNIGCHFPLSYLDLID